MQLNSSMRERWEKEGDDWLITLPEGWGQGRTIYGGMSTAAAVSLGIQLVGSDRRLRGMQTQFVSPIAAGPVRGRATVLREGRTTSFVRVELSQETGLALVATLVFFVPQEGKVACDQSKTFSAPDPESLTDLPFIPGVFPEFTQNLHLRFANGHVPYSGANAAGFQGYSKFKEAAGGPEGLVAMLDVWPAPSLSLLSGPAPASSVSWTAHFFDFPESHEGWFGMDYTTVKGEAGMHTVTGSLYGPEGKILAVTEQLVAVFG